MDAAMLESWLKKRKKRLKEEMAQNGKSVGLPNGLTIHFNINGLQGQNGTKIPLTPDGKSVATRDSVAQYPG